MIFSNSCVLLKDVPKNHLVCGLIGQTKEKEEYKLLTEHYFVGEYFCLYIAGRMVHQGAWSDLKNKTAEEVMNIDIRHHIRRFLADGGKITSIYYREKSEK